MEISFSFFASDPNDNNPPTAFAFVSTNDDVRAFEVVAKTFVAIPGPLKIEGVVGAFLDSDWEALAFSTIAPSGGLALAYLVALAEAVALPVALRAQES